MRFPSDLRLSPRSRCWAAPIQRRKPTNLQNAFAPAQHLDLNEQLANKVALIPGYGGWYYDSGGDAVIVLVDENWRSVAEADLRSELQGTNRHAAAVRIQRGRYDYAQLYGWAKRVDDSLARIPGLVFIDVNERENNVALPAAPSFRL
jgi:hypothetical protein